MAEDHGILVVGELEGGKLASLSKELLGGARRLAAHGNEEVSLLLFGEKAAAFAPEGIQLGADKVYVAAHPVFSEFNSDAYTILISELCQKVRPFLCLMGQTDLGRDVAPRVAARLDAGLCMDCVEVNADSEQWHYTQTRPVYGGKALAMVGSEDGRMQIDTVRPKSMPPWVPQGERKGETVILSEGLDVSSLKVRCLKREYQEAVEVNLEEAKVIVAGGGGVGGAEGFQKIKELAKALGGAVGATRVPVDE
jgi:electron transfer flavoprotein alpha subunit